MSHISKIELEVNDLSVLQKACNRLGLNFVSGQKTFKWYGAEDGKCDHAITIPKGFYEIGVVLINGKYELQCDYWDSSIGAAIGNNGGLLKQAYAAERARIEALRKGFRVIERRTDNGLRLHVRMN